MRTLAPAIKVGLTFVIAAASGYWVFTMLAKGSWTGDGVKMMQVHAYLRDATLLVEKSRVQIAGLNVGHIAARELSVQPPRPSLVEQKRFAKITVALEQNVTLYSNAVIKKKSASLLGEFYLEIDPGTHEWVDERGQKHVGEILKDGDEIQLVVEAATAGALVAEITEMLPLVKQIAEDVRGFIKGPLYDISNNVNAGITENREALRELLDSIQAITTNIKDVTEHADDNVANILTDIRDITKNLRTYLGTDSSYASDYSQKIKQSLETLNSAVQKLDRTLANVEEITGGIKEGKGNVGRLLKDEKLVNDVEGIVSDTGDFVRSVVGLQTIVGLRSEYNFLSGGIKTYLSVELKPRPDKYYLIELINDPRGRRDISTTVTRSDDPSKPLLTREDRVEISDNFRITFQFAKQIRFATFRFGIKESTGGVGVDFELFRERLRIQTDLFDFDANIVPRWKILAGWQFFKRLYVVGGIDDLLNERPLDGVGGGRDYFLGAQLRFNDEDLKQLLLFGGSSLGASTGN